MNSAPLQPQAQAAMAGEVACAFLRGCGLTLAATTTTTITTQKVTKKATKKVITG